ncbi:hypothetical protein SDC9_176076 [bioreactor metagenome]|uniref:Uncharacterized protein n=1 Tax=bioreactor metagenome TaxID=1076179 RepID=A0A645GYC1_9ZZZZ
MAGFHSDKVHIIHAGAYVFGSNIAAVKAFYKAAKSPEQHFAFIFFGIADYNGFRPT